MRLELLAFDLLVLGPPIVASVGLCGRSAFFLDRWRSAWASAAIVAVPGLLWLGWLQAAGAISFSATRSLSGAWPSIDVLLLVPALVFACVFGWALGFAGRAPSIRVTPVHKVGWLLHGIPVACAGLGAAALREGVTAGAVALLAIGTLSVMDLGLRSRLIPRPRFWAYLLATCVATLVFGGALIEREIVTHADAAVLGIRLIGVPIEDLGFAVVLAGAGAMLFERFELQAATRPRKGLIARWIERRFGGYRHQLAPIDEQAAAKLSKPRSVAIVGSGLAGLGAASKLATRGFAVTLFERNDYLGGKLGAWKTTLPDGRELGMSHGFHAFFHHYYNLNAWFAELGIDRHFRNIGDYLILTADGRSYSFKDIATTPILNLLSLARHGVYNLREVAPPPTGPKMEALLRYDPAETYAAFDHVSYAEFAEDAKLPQSLALVFNTFSRAFFSDAEQMSMAELIKSFHFYYLSNDSGLIYEYLDDDFDRVLLGPVREHLIAHGAEIHTGCAVESVEREADGGFRIGDERFDDLIVASDVVGTRALFSASPSLAAAAPETAAKVESLRPGQRYSVLRLWLDRTVTRELPGFIITERVRILDAVTFVHEIEAESAAWVAERAAAGLGGGVIEVHCYALPEQLPDDEDALRRMFVTELEQFFPELVGAEIIHATMYVRRDFPGFHVGKHATRPSWDTELPNLFLAGDWVVLPFPAMLMEAAYSAGLLAANAICRRESVRETPVWTVPLRGLMAGWPKTPTLR